MKARPVRNAKKLLAPGHNAQLHDHGYQENRGQNLGKDERHLNQKIFQDGAHAQSGFDEIIQTVKEVRKQINACTNPKANAHKEKGSASKHTTQDIREEVYESCFFPPDSSSETES